MSVKTGSNRILIVDDEVDITSVLKVGLKRRGFDVDVYNDPLVALSTFESNVYRVAVLDIRMPKMNGFELYRQLTNVDPELIICFFTAFDVHQSEFEKLFPELKPKAFFCKPMPLEELAFRLNELITVETDSIELSTHSRNQDR